MLFSIYGEVGLCVCGLLYVLDKWFNSFIDLITLMKDNDEKEQPMSESAKRMYS